MNQVLAQTRRYLTERLIPFWASRAYEPRAGGFQTNYDRQGRRVASQEKTLLCQARCLFTIAFAQRQGFDWPDGEAQLAGGLAFLLDQCRDPEHDGYYWIVDQQGAPLDDSKVVYGHSFVIYALAELALLTGDAQAAHEARRVFELLQTHCRDAEHGGYLEHFHRDWRVKRARNDQPLHKSLDVHMHLMEAFTTLYELTGEAQHRQALLEVAELIWTRMVDPASGAGISMFRPDWTPIANVELDTVWGSDRFAREKTPSITSYGHNIELAWLYLHALEVLGCSGAAERARAEAAMRHTLAHGVDWTYGGLWVEGERDGGPTERNKEFWQQAEGLVGLLDAYLLTHDDAFLGAFRNLYTFVFEKMINWPAGEWFPLLDESGAVLWDYMGHNWKTCYHTVRSMVLVVRKLEQIVGAADAKEGKSIMPLLDYRGLARQHTRTAARLRWWVARQMLAIDCKDVGGRSQESAIPLRQLADNPERYAVMLRYARCAFGRHWQLARIEPSRGGARRLECLVVAMPDERQHCLWFDVTPEQS